MKRINRQVGRSMESDLWVTLCKRRIEHHFQRRHDKYAAQRRELIREAIAHIRSESCTTI